MGSDMKNFALVLAALLLQACSPKVVLPNGGTITEAAYVHLETLKVVEKVNSASQACFDAVATIPSPTTSDPMALAVSGMAKANGIQSCNAGGGGQAKMQPPVYVPQPSFGEKLATGAINLATGLAGPASAAFAAKYQRDATISAQNAQTAQNGQMWSGIASLVRDTTSAQQQTTGQALGAMADLGSAAFASSAASSAANAAALQNAYDVLRAGFRVLPDLTPSITAGTSVTQGNNNDLSTRRDTLTAGTELRIDSPSLIDMSRYELVCTAAPATSTTGAPSTTQICTPVLRQ